MDVAVVDRVAVAKNRAVPAENVAVGASADSDGAVALRSCLVAEGDIAIPKLTLRSSVMLVAGLMKLLLLARSALGEKSGWVAYLGSNP